MLRRLRRMLVAHHLQRWERRTTALEDLTSRLSRHGVHLQFHFEGIHTLFTGSALGWPVDYRPFVVGEDAIWTRASLDVFRDGLELDIRPRNLPRFLGSRASLMGDPAFDRRYVVRSTDADMARAVLDDEARRWLIALKSARLRLGIVGLVFEKQWHSETEDSIRKILLGLVHVAERIALVGEARGYREQGR
jgi:hypothetical protein